MFEMFDSLTSNTEDRPISDYVKDTRHPKAVMPVNQELVMDSPKVQDLQGVTGNTAPNAGKNAHIFQKHFNVNCKTRPTISLKTSQSISKQYNVRVVLIYSPK